MNYLSSKGAAPQSLTSREILDIMIARYPGLVGGDTETNGPDVVQDLTGLLTRRDDEESL